MIIKKIIHIDQDGSERGIMACYIKGKITAMDMTYFYDEMTGDMKAQRQGAIAADLFTYATIGKNFPNPENYMDVSAIDYWENLRKTF